MIAKKTTNQNYPKPDVNNSLQDIATTPSTGNYGTETRPRNIALMYYIKY